MRSRSAGAEDRRLALRVPRTLWARGNAEICMVPDFLSDGEIAHLLDLASWERSTMRFVKYDGEGHLESEEAPRHGAGRTSSTCTLRPAQDDRVISIERRLARLANSEVACLEPLNLVRYEPGQFFRPHHDGGHRAKTVFLYLNDLPDGAGGETHFVKLDLKIPPRRGCAVVWSNLTPEGLRDERMWHQGLPPLDTTKYGMNAFFRSVPCRDSDSLADDRPGPEACPAAPAS
mmetsp:Transcript_96446/g.259003  ORF Transcript_96446/g.259003 Transcript_96446/m.259003 type:complete len:232 (+) Transcript_96446:2-697(+)